MAIVKKLSSKLGREWRKPCYVPLSTWPLRRPPNVKVLPMLFRSTLAAASTPSRVAETPV
ncbi:hypothetical protein AB7M49_003994 [Bradyrhizobium elkanii]|nr:hypothetical protein [Bradyrhizobium elkanii]MCP1972076.1 hypothetical protein [Bradyrhizobium elkanii]MCS4106414.1 hypothetical protein [Bradyrhizobium elkanii]